MKTTILFGSGILAAWLTTPVVCERLAQCQSPHQGIAPDPVRVRASLERVPLHFEENFGQVESAVKFVSRGNGCGLFLMPGEIVVTLERATRIPPDNHASHKHPAQVNKRRTADPVSQSPRPELGILHLRCVGSNWPSLIEGLQELTAKINYFSGSDPARWHRDIPTYAKVRYRRVYPGIDWVFYGSQHQLEYDFVVAPGADAKEIALAFEGADGVGISSDGDLIVRLGQEEITQRKPIIYQEVDGVKKRIPGGYVLRENSSVKSIIASSNSKPQTPIVGFQVGSYDRSKPLIIDPVLSFARAFGGSGLSQGLGIALDSQGNAYVTGRTTSTNFPTANPLQAKLNGSGAFNGDAFVAKFSTNGTLIYATYLGGSGDESGNGIAVDAAGNAYVTGYTSSRDFPTTNALQKTFGGFQDAFVSKLDPSGSKLLYSTYLGGSGVDIGNGIAIDSSGNAYVTGQTGSANFPMVNSIQLANRSPANAFVAKLNAAGTALVYSTYLGGTGFDFGHGISVDAAGNAYVAGEAGSADFPIANAVQSKFGGGFNDGFVAKLNAAGSALVYSTYLGGSGNDTARAVSVDANGNAYVTGTTQSSDFPIKNPLQANRRGLANVFVTKLSADGAGLVYSTYLGGGGVDDGNGIAVDSSGNAYVVGSADSPNFPQVSPVQTSGGGGLFKSTNSAGSWAVSNSGLTGSTVNAILFDPTNPATLYAGIYGGVFKSTNGGASWTALLNGLSDIYVLALALDSSAPGTLYASTQGGLFKTVNAGNSWTASNQGLPASFVNALAIDPKTPATVYAGTDGNGVYKSTDGAAHWNAINNRLAGPSIKALLIDPSSPSTIYAGAGGFVNPGVYKSTDGGASWTAMNTGLPGQGVNALSMDPANSLTLYAAVDTGFGGPTGGVYKSTDGGATWSAVILTDFHMASVAVDPANSLNLYAGPIGHSGRGLFKSTDGGANWTETGLNNQGIIRLAIDPTHPSQLYVGVDGGSDAFVAELNSSGSALLFSSFYGGTGTDFGQGIALDLSNQIHITGYSHSLDIAGRPALPQSAIRMSAHERPKRPVALEGPPGPFPTPREAVQFLAQEQADALYLLILPLQAVDLSINALYKADPVTKSVSTEAISTGEPAAYVVAVLNTVGTATFVVLNGQVTVPGGPVAKVTSTRGILTDNGGGKFTVTVDELDAGEDFEVTIITTPTKTGQITLKFDVSSPQPDVDPSNNLDSRTDQVLLNAKLHAAQVGGQINLTLGADAYNMGFRIWVSPAISPSKFALLPNPAIQEGDTYKWSVPIGDRWQFYEAKQQP